MAFANVARAEEPLPPRLKALMDHAFDADSNPDRLYLPEVRQLDRRLETLEDDPQLTDIREMQQVGSKLAALFLRAKMIQDALWALRRADLNEDARALESRAKKFLLEAQNPRSTRASPKGISHAEFLNFGKGLDVVVKVGRKSTSRQINRKSVFAYAFDRHIGLNRVPLTVEREYLGLPATFQLFIRHTTRTALRFKTKMYMPELDFSEEVYPFDYLTVEDDRHGDNSLYSSTGRLVLHDNDHTLHSSTSGGWATPQPEGFAEMGGIIHPRLLARIHQLNHDTTLNDVGLGLRPADFAEVWHRTIALRHVFPKPAFARIDQKIATGLRMDDYLTDQDTGLGSKTGAKRLIDACLRAIGF